MKYTLILLLATTVGLKAQPLFSGEQPSLLATQKSASSTILIRDADSDNYRLRYEFNDKGFLVPKIYSVKAAQDEDRTNVVGPGFYAMPDALVNANALILNAEFEHFFNEKNSIAGRVEFISYSYEDDADDYFEKGSGSGGGVGFSYRHYFGNYGGFYISPAVEFVILKWDYEYYGYGSYSEYGNGTSLAICPNFSVGYRFNIGEGFSLTPSVMLGYRAGISIEYEGEAEGESGPLGGIGVAFGFRF